METVVSPLDNTEFDVDTVRRHFPILGSRVHGHPLIYLDNAATTQKPQAVIDAIVDYYTSTNANIHRGVHQLSVDATRMHDNSRAKVKSFLNADEIAEIIFVRGATEGINLVASTFGKERVGPGDEVVITAMEHHSNIVPWQVLCEQQGANLRVAPIDEQGQLLWDDFESLINKRTKLVAVAHVSNALGTVNPIREIVSLSHQHGAAVIVDGAQAAAHMPVDVQDLDCDFYVISGHKLYGPTGIGVIYGKRELLESMPAYQTGGDMISSVTFEQTTYNTLPHKFEAGTPDIAGAIGLGAAIDYLKQLDWPAVCAHEEELLTHATDALSSINGVRIIGTADEKRAVLSFVIEGAHPHDIGTILDHEGIAVRTGHHCAQPVMERFGVPATIRISLGLYNTRDEIDATVCAINKVKEVFRC
ncbi:cysteine desulfurase [Gimesia panareensis]|uniref:cysteine desulfurase n=1 Tax=Gimesia panareensis TaxID=2527978 RepID=UPI00118A7F33|nr:putative cysteine desulfurase [Gimesia panareensis]